MHSNFAERTKDCQEIRELFSALASVEHKGKSSRYLGELLKKILPMSKFLALAVHRANRGRWRITASAGEEVEPPLELLAETLDSGKMNQHGRWIAVPLNTDNGRSEVYCGFSSVEIDAPIESDLNALGALCEHFYSIARRNNLRDYQIDRLRAILEIATQWNQSQDTQSLLNQMAEASTELIGAERASIFLWDRAAKLLIGRPAMGVEGNQLVIPDDTGIVGQVIQTGQSRRVDADIEGEQAEIDRSVDKKLEYRTETILCVPMTGSQGKLLGAFELLNKIDGQFTDSDEAALHELAVHAAVAIEKTQQFETLIKKQKQMASEAAGQIQLIGKSVAMRQLSTTIEKIAGTELAVLILGENGTGKEVVSRMIHFMSQRKNEPLVAVNCAAISESLLESELFGHEKGAFTDAHEARAGKFELASGGTLFLDEIGDMSLGGQAKLLRVLEEKTVVRVGGSVPIPTDVRVCAATNQDLGELVREKKFREDLFFRLSVVTIDLPPLRDRDTDVLELAEFFLSDFSAKARKPLHVLTDGAKEKLLAHRWPGNVRELRNMMERLVYLAPDTNIDAKDFSFSVAVAPDAENMMDLSLSLNDATKNFQVEFIHQQIESTRGNMTEAAKKLGLHRSNLYRKMRQLGMETDE